MRGPKTMGAHVRWRVSWSRCVGGLLPLLLAVAFSLVVSACGGGGGEEKEKTHGARREATVKADQGRNGRGFSHEGHDDFLIGHAEAAGDEHETVNRRPCRQRFEWVRHSSHRGSANGLNEEGDEGGQGQGNVKLKKRGSSEGCPFGGGMEKVLS